MPSFIPKLPSHKPVTSKTLQKYAIVQYPDYIRNGIAYIECIPSIWTFEHGGKMFCRYPAGLEMFEINRLAENCSNIEDHVTEEWKINILSTKETLTEAKEKLKKCQEKTEQTTSEEDSEACSSPAKKRKSITSAARSSGADFSPFDDLPVISTLRETVPRRSLPESQGRDETPQKIVRIVELNYQELQDLKHQLANQTNQLANQANDMAKMQEQLDGMSRAIDNFANQRGESGSHQRVHAKTAKKPDCLPTSSIDEVHALEALLKDKERNKDEIGNILDFLQYEVDRSGCWKTGTRKILAEVFGIQVQTLINWEGPSKKSNGLSFPQAFPSILQHITCKFIIYLEHYT
ncbi:Hypothetical predicted protein [Cloeon dipterum]|uniref:DUF4806 domain-containing protein n=1 Tax=Cloeon dipterum TaxID=197152 RepID=A0A8S1DI46_9INSE|nr:Hypothetical predicted protein [Cloeon dipterum]